jgi:hypothetical protein
VLPPLFKKERGSTALQSKYSLLKILPFSINKLYQKGCSPLFFKERGPTAKQAGGESTAVGFQTVIRIAPCLGLYPHNHHLVYPKKAYFKQVLYI